MIQRPNFFVASLWASLVPVGLMALICAVLILAPLTGNFVETARRAAQLGLILVPFAYTGLVVTTYGVARALRAVKLLNRLTLPCAYALLALAGAGIFSKISAWVDFAEGSSLRAFAIMLALGLVSLLSACWVWWRVASRPTTIEEEEPRRRRRRSRGRSRERPPAQPQNPVAGSQ